MLRLGFVAPGLGVERVEGFSALRQGGVGISVPRPNVLGMGSVALFIDVERVEGFSALR